MKNDARRCIRKFKPAGISLPIAVATALATLAFSASAEEAQDTSVLGTIWTANGNAGSEECSSFLEPEVFSSLPSSTIASCLNSETVNNRNAQGWTVLHLAAARGSDANLVHHLVALGADMTLLDRQNREPIHVAAQVGSSPEIIVAMALAGADVDSPMNQKRDWLGHLPLVGKSFGTTPLHLAAARTDAEDLVAALLLAGADPEIREPTKQQTALHLATERPNNRGIINLLLRKGADPNTGDVSGTTPLMLAIKNSPDSPIVNWMLSVGGNADKARDDGVTALMAMAELAKSERAFELLLEASRKHCKENDQGISAMSLAAKNENLRNSRSYWNLHQECSSND